MLKVITIITKFIVAIIISLLFTSCVHELKYGKSIKGNGEITTITRDIQEKFRNIEVKSGIKVVIEQSNYNSVKVEADSNLQELISTEVENGVLIIKPNKSYSCFHSPKVFIKTPVIEGLEATSSSEIKSINTLKGENISLSTSSAGEIDVDIEFDNINLDTSSGSSIIAKGKALKLKTEASSGSSINGQNLLANNIIADASSGSVIKLSPILSLDAKASSGASIKYSKTPKTINRNTSSGGSVDSIFD